MDDFSGLSYNRNETFFPHWEVNRTGLYQNVPLHCFDDDCLMPRSYLSLEVKHFPQGDREVSGLEKSVRAETNSTW